MAAILPGGLVRIDTRLANAPNGLRRINARPPNINPRRPTLSPWAPNFDPRAPNLNAMAPDIGLRLSTIDTEVPIKAIDTANAPNLDTLFLIIVLVIPWATMFGLPVYLIYVLCTDGPWATIEAVRTISGATASIVVAGLVAVALWTRFKEPIQEVLTLWHGYTTEGMFCLRRLVVRDTENPDQTPDSVYFDADDGGPRSLDGFGSGSSSPSSGGSPPRFRTARLSGWPSDLLTVSTPLPASPAVASPDDSSRHTVHAETPPLPPSPGHVTSELHPPLPPSPLESPARASNLLARRQFGFESTPPGLTYSQLMSWLRNRWETSPSPPPFPPSPCVFYPNVRNKDTGSSEAQLPIPPLPGSNTSNDHSQRTVPPEPFSRSISYPKLPTPPPETDHVFSRNSSRLMNSNGQSQHTVACETLPPPISYPQLPSPPPEIDDASFFGIPTGMGLAKLTSWDRNRTRARTSSPQSRSSGRNVPTTAEDADDVDEMTMSGGLGPARPSHESQPRSSENYVPPTVEDADDVDETAMSGGIDPGPRSWSPKMRSPARRPPSPPIVDGILERYPDNPRASKENPLATKFSDLPSRTELSITPTRDLISDIQNEPRPQDEDADGITMSGAHGQAPDLPRLRRSVQRPRSPTRVDGVLDRYPDDPRASAVNPLATSFLSARSWDSHRGISSSRSADPWPSPWHAADPSLLDNYFFPERLQKRYLQSQLPNVGGSEAATNAPLFETRSEWLLRNSREWEEKGRSIEGGRNSERWQPSVQDVWPNSKPKLPRDEEYERRKKKKTVEVYHRKFV